MDINESTSDTTPPAAASATRPHNPYLVPISIVLAGGLIALAVMVTNMQGNSPLVNGNPGQQVGNQQGFDGDFGNARSASVADIRPVDANDHVWGNPNAPVAIVEFSDYQCPFCTRLHPTLEQIVADFDGQVKWIYRHFPLTQIHPQAIGAAVASECVAELAGNAAFWKYTAKVLVEHRRLGTDLISETIAELGIDEAAFNTCMTDPETPKLVEQDFIDAQNIGISGTPYAVVINAAGEVFPFSGAQPYDVIHQVVTQALGTDV